MEPGYTTCILHHPARPVDCVVRVLDALAGATREPHRVEVVIQGPSRDPLPPVDAYPRLELEYIQLPRNTGLSAPAAESMARATTRFWAKLDDDMVLPPRAWDILAGGIEGWAKRYGARAGAAMMATGGLNARRLVRRDGRLVEEDEGPDNLSMRTRHGTFELSDVVGSGATLFDMAVLRAGSDLTDGTGHEHQLGRVQPEGRLLAAFDPRYQVGGADVDLCMQMGERGWPLLLCTWPRVTHIYKECSPPAYEQDRWSAEDLEASRQIFASKWGVRPPF